MDYYLPVLQLLQALCGDNQLGELGGLGTQDLHQCYLFFFFMFFIFKDIKLLNKKDQIIKVSSIIAIFGLINVPIIKYSVDWWTTLHQPASIKITGSSSIHSEMMLPLMVMALVFLLYAALIFLMKYKTEIIRIKKKNIKRD